MHSAATRGLLGAVLLALAHGILAQAPADFAGLNAQATVAYQARDFAVMQQRLEQALEMRPGHPKVTYNLACAQALRGQAEAAFGTLARLAGWGLYYDLAAEPDFAGLRTLPAFSGLRARFDANLKPAGRARMAFTVARPDFVPEGIAYDGDTGAYFLGGVHARRIVRIKNGQVQDFAGAGSGLLAPFGMAADSRRRLLWVVHAGVEEMEGVLPENLGQSGVLGFDLDSGKIKRQAQFDDGIPHALGDLALAADGRVYVSDTRTGRVYRLDTTRGQFQPLTAPGALISPQGLAPSRDGRTLYVADYSQGLLALNLENGELSPLTGTDAVHLFGIDALARHANGLVAVQNGYRPHRVLQLSLDPAGKRLTGAKVLAANLPEFEEPTLGVVVGDGFVFVANSQWNRFNAQHQLPPLAELKNPVALRVAVEAE